MPKGVYLRTKKAFFYGKHRSSATKKKISDALKGRKLSASTRRKMSEARKNKAGLWNKGLKRSAQTKKKISLAQKKMVKEGKHNLWKGGITPHNQKIRHSFEYTQWRKSIFKRDNYTCQMCGERGVRIEAHHILSFESFPKWRFDKKNGKTLCKICHQSIREKEWFYAPRFLNI